MHLFYNHLFEDLGPKIFIQLTDCKQIVAYILKFTEGHILRHSVFISFKQYGVQIKYL